MHLRLSLPIAMLLVASYASAQPRIYVPPKVTPDTSTFYGLKDITIGPYFTAGYSRQTQKLPDGWHSNPLFAYTFGGTIDATINSWLGVTLSALYDSRDLYLATSGDADNIDLNIGYIAIQPSVRIFWLLIGLAFDLPMNGSAVEHVATFQNPRWRVNPAPYSGNLNADTGDLSTLTELRATLSIPILQVESGVLHLVVSGNFPLGQAVTGTTSFDTTGHFSGIRAPGQGPLPTVEAGLSYQFDLLH
jgi:hypothetical protein